MALHQPRIDVGAAAGRQTDHDLQGLAGIKSRDVISAGRAGGKNQSTGQREALHQAAAPARCHATAVAQLSAGGRYSSSPICDVTPSFLSVSSYSRRRNGSSSQYGMAVPPSVTSIAPSSVSFSPGTPGLSLR